MNKLTYLNLQKLDMRAENSASQKPVLLMFGRDDPFGLQVTEAIQEAFVNAAVKFVVSDHCWHFRHECPQEFYPYLLDFLRISDSAGISNFNLVMECYK